MPQRRYTNTSTSTRDTRYSDYSYESRSTAHTSLYDSSLTSTQCSPAQALKPQSQYLNEDLSPSTSLYPRSSVDTYSSRASELELGDVDVEDLTDEPAIPPLPAYRHEIEEFNVRPSTPEDFAALFPSMNRLTIRHDDFTSDGNMNLRVDTVVSGRRKKTIQLFHLRMYDLSKRDFSLRRYCRDSGREVCNSKRKYLDPASSSHPHLQRSVTNMVKTLAGKPSLSRAPTSGHRLPPWSRPTTSHSTAEADAEFADSPSRADSLDKQSRARAVATNAIKLEFSNYARVDVRRRGNKNSKRYEFAWWENQFAWKRVVDRLTGAVSFHLLRDGNSSTPVAHIVPETRSPNQVAADEYAGGWIPPCHMWISDASLISPSGGTDYSDVVVATGLVALVDDCIKERWQRSQRKGKRRLSLPLTSSRTVDAESSSGGPRAFVQHLLQRRDLDYGGHHPNSPLRHERAVRAC
ncbi:hypothetical protein GGR56DRAFT_353058 [Xylariaceae sp. FL0804]|nr:hypothetical protein GGR56DRAFT_353058 [Xylariaceae sp. FL0804]